MSEMDTDELYKREARGTQRQRHSALPLDSLGFGGYTSPVGRGRESKSFLDPLEGTETSFTGAAAMTEDAQPQPRVARASRIRNTTTDETRQTQGPRKETFETLHPPSNRAGARIEPDSLEEDKHRSPLSKRFQSISRRTRMIAIFVASIIVTLLLVLLYQQIANVVTTTLDDQRYGRPRTFQADAFVGHERGNIPSHFIALNLQGHIEIIELPGGHPPTDIHEYSVPSQLFGPNSDLVPPTLQFVDTNRVGIKDMILRAGDIQLHFINDPTTDTFQLQS